MPTSYSDINRQMNRVMEIFENLDNELELEELRTLQNMIRSRMGNANPIFLDQKALMRKIGVPENSEEWSLGIPENELTDFVSAMFSHGNSSVAGLTEFLDTDPLESFHTIRLYRDTYYSNKNE